MPRTYLVIRYLLRQNWWNGSFDGKTWVANVRHRLIIDRSCFRFPDLCRDIRSDIRPTVLRLYTPQCIQLVLRGQCLLDDHCSEHMCQSLMLCCRHSVWYNLTENNTDFDLRKTWIACGAVMIFAATICYANLCTSSGTLIGRAAFRICALM